MEKVKTIYAFFGGIHGFDIRPDPHREGKCMLTNESAFGYRSLPILNAGEVRDGKRQPCKLTELVGRFCRVNINKGEDRSGRERYYLYLTALPVGEPQSEYKFFYLVGLRNIETGMGGYRKDEIVSPYQEVLGFSNKNHWNLAVISPELPLRCKFRWRSNRLNDHDPQYYEIQGISE